MIKKTIKKFIIGVLSLLALMIISYFIFIANAEKIVKEIVTYYTNGTMRIEMKNLSFNPRELRITIDNANFSTINTAHQNSTYNITVDTMVLELASIRPLLLHRKLYIDSITFKRPSISVIQWKELKKENFSLPQQMGKIYTSLNNTLDKLGIKYCLLDSGAFSIEDKVHPERKKVTVTDFYFLIDNLHKTANLNNDDRFFFSDRIKFYSSHQQITLASGNQQISYSRLRINSGRKIIELDSCFVYSKKNKSDFNSFSGYFDTLKFTNVDFEKLTQDNILDADSAFCIRPKIILKTSVNENKTNKLLPRAMSRDSFTVLMKYLLGNFNLNYIGVNNATIEIQTKSDSKISTYQIKRTDFSMHDVSMVDHPDSAIKVGSFDLGLIGYKAYDSDSNYLINFDSIHFLNDKIFLSDFKFLPAKKSQTNEFKNISMSSLAINSISWIDLLADRKIVANDIELINPEIKLHLSVNKNIEKQKNKLTILSAFKKIIEYADVVNLKIRNAHFQMNQGDNFVGLTNLNCSVPVNRLLKSKTLNDFLSASVFVDFETAKIVFKQNQFLLKRGKYDGNRNTLLIKEVLADDDKNSFHGYFQNLMITNLSENSPDHFELSSLSWNKANLLLNSTTSTNKKDEFKSRQLFTVAKIQGTNTLFKIEGNLFSTNGTLPKIDITGFATETNRSFFVKDINFRGNKISMIKKGLRLNINQLDFQNKNTSSITGLQMNSDSGKNKIEMNIPNVVFTADINEAIKKQFSLGEIVIQEPSVSILNNGDYKLLPDDSKEFKFPEINISKIIVNNPKFRGAAFEGKIQPYIKEINSTIRLNGIIVQNEQIKIDNGIIKLADLKFITPKFSLMIPADTIMRLFIKDVDVALGNNKNNLKWHFQIDSLTSDNFSLKLQKDSIRKQKFNIKNSFLSNLHINNNNAFSLYEILAVSPKFSIEHIDVDMIKNEDRFKIYNLSYSEKIQQLDLDSFSFRPLAEKADFIYENDYQKDYPVFSTGKINVNNFNLLKLFKDSVFTATYVNITHPDLYTFKDKRKPFNKGLYKPLPSAMMKNINFKIDIDSVKVNDGVVVYEELNDKTNKSGLVKISQLDAIVNNFKNHNLKETDSLRLYLTGNFMDSAKIRFRLSESFTDSLHAFTYGLRFRPFNFKILNPILEPLFSVRIISGSLDTLRVNAIGREHTSYGKMNMYYKDLKIQYLNNGNDSLKNLKSRLINFVANDLLLKRNNKNGLGIVYAERDKERGFANYWLKIGLSGVLSSSRVKKNKKVENKYKKQLKKMKVPDITEVDL